MRTSRGGRSPHQGVSTCCSPPHRTCRSAGHTLGPPTIDIFLASIGRSNKLTVSASSWQPETCWKLISFGPVSLQDKEHHMQRSEACSPRVAGGGEGGEISACLAEPTLMGRQQSFARQGSWGMLQKPHLRLLALDVNWKSFFGDWFLESFYAHDESTSSNRSSVVGLELRK